MASFSQSFFNVGFRYLWKTLSLPLLCGWYGAENIQSIPSYCKTWYMRLFLNSILLSKKMYHGHMCTGKYSFIIVRTIASLVLSGIGKTSGHPVRSSIIVKMCLLPDVEVSMLTVAGVVIGSSTNHERQSAALFLSPEIQSKAILYVASPRLHLLTLLLAFFPFKKFARSL